MMADDGGASGGSGRPEAAGRLLVLSTCEDVDVVRTLAQKEYSS